MIIFLHHSNICPFVPVAPLLLLLLLPPVGPCQHSLYGCTSRVSCLGSSVVSGTHTTTRPSSRSRHGYVSRVVFICCFCEISRLRTTRSGDINSGGDKRFCCVRCGHPRVYAVAHVMSGSVQHVEASNSAAQGKEQVFLIQDGCAGSKSFRYFVAIFTLVQPQVACTGSTYLWRLFENATTHNCFRHLLLDVPRAPDTSSELPPVFRGLSFDARGAGVPLFTGHM